MVYDELLDADDAYFINDEYVSQHILTGANMKVKKLAAPWNQDAIGRRYVLEHQLCAWKQYRTNARVTNGA